MRKYPRRLLLFGALLLGPLLLVPAAQAQPPAPTWQYARLSLATVAGALTASWTAPDAKEFAQGGILPLAEQVMNTAISDTDDALIVFLNFLGGQGWELVAVTVDARGRQDFYFKRTGGS